MAAQNMTIQKIAEYAFMAQNAVNVSGLVIEWARWQTTISEDARARGIDRNTHPVNVIMADKLADLCGRSYDAYSAAYTKCQQIAAETAETIVQGN